LLLDNTTGRGGGKKNGARGDRLGLRDMANKSKENQRGGKKKAGGVDRQ